MTAITASKNPQEISQVRNILDYNLAQNELRFFVDELDVLENIISDVIILRPGGYIQAKISQFKGQFDKQKVLIIQLQQELRGIKNQLLNPLNPGAYSFVKFQEQYKNRLMNIKHYQNELKLTFGQYINHELV